MISLSKTYAENIANYQHFEKFVDGIVLRGEDIETKYKLLIDTDDIVNIVVLSLILIKEKRKESKTAHYDHLNCIANKPCIHTPGPSVNYAKLHSKNNYDRSIRGLPQDKNSANFSEQKPTFKNGSLNQYTAPTFNIEKVGALFSTLPEKTREQIVFSIGLDNIIELSLDDTKGFSDTFLTITQSHNYTTPKQKPLNPNIEK